MSGWVSPKFLTNQKGGEEEKRDEKENDQCIISKPSTTTNMESAQKHGVPVCNSIHTKNWFSNQVDALEHHSA